MLRLQFYEIFIVFPEYKDIKHLEKCDENVKKVFRRTRIGCYDLKKCYICKKNAQRRV